MWYSAYIISYATDTCMCILTSILHTCTSLYDMYKLNMIRTSFAMEWDLHMFCRTDADNTLSSFGTSKFKLAQNCYNMQKRLRYFLISKNQIGLIRKTMAS